MAAASAPGPAPVAHVEAVRRFNRFYTREVGLLRKTFLDSPWTLGEMRVLFEIAYGKLTTAGEIAAKLDLDPAYLSRLLRGFETKGLISRSRSESDARQSDLRLTAKGREQLGPADRRQSELVRTMLGRLRKEDQERLVGAMATIQLLMGEARASVEKRSYTLREPRTGDFGWIVSRHAELYAREYGWGGTFEGVCAQIVADFVNKFDPKLERCWIADMDGERVGTVMLVKDDPEAKKADVSRIRLLLVDPRARGLGLGRRLVEECVSFSREKGYRRMTLWTHQELAAARAIYAQVGFTLSGSETHDDWGRPAVSEFWDMEL